jgi:hypothetical protein
MDHLGALREKIRLLRQEIADIQELNERSRGVRRNRIESESGYSHRNERLQAIQQELVRLAALGRKVIPIDEVREKHRSRLPFAEEEKAS